MSGAEYARYARDLARAATGIDVKGEAAAEKVGKGALASARANVPVLSGALKNSLYLTQSGARAVVGTDLFYARFVEYGTTRMAPDPFIGPAFVEWAPKLVQEVEGIRDDVIEDLT
jgi:HK97 gp10 family phage protein